MMHPNNIKLTIVIIFNEERAATHSQSRINLIINQTPLIVYLTLSLTLMLPEMDRIEGCLIGGIAHHLNLVQQLRPNCREEIEILLSLD